MILGSPSLDKQTKSTTVQYMFVGGLHIVVSLPAVEEGGDLEARNKVDNQ